MALLASDLNNPEFAGAVNPDSMLAVRFYSRPVRNNYESEQAGRPIFKDVDYVEIMKPGDPTSILDVPVREDHKARFPMHWAHYQNRRGDAQGVVGTPLSQWPRITPAMAEELKALKFYTVENVAGASDQALQRIGMIAGMGPMQFRDAAIRYLQVSKDESSVSQAAEAAKKAEERAQALEAEVAQMREQMAQLLADKNGEAPRRGRPPKAAQE